MSRGKLTPVIAKVPNSPTIEGLGQEAAKCPCCGSTMDLWGRSFARKVSIDGIQYFCNNPVCCCDLLDKDD